MRDGGQDTITSPECQLTPQCSQRRIPDTGLAAETLGNGYHSLQLLKGTAPDNRRVGVAPHGAEPGTGKEGLNSDWEVGR